MTADLRAGIEALCDEYALLSGDTFRRVTADLTGLLLAAHPVQDEVAARAYFGEGYEFALIHLDDEPVQADLARLRPDRPVQVTTAEVGEALRQTAEIETAWRYECQVPMPRLWVRRFLAALDIVVSDRSEVTP